MGYFAELDYKKIVKNWLELQPQQGRGQYKKMADALMLSAVTISQVFNGEKHLSLEQAFKLADFMHLTDLKKEYFLQAVQFARAGSKELEDYFAGKLSALRQQSQDLKTRLVQDKSLSETDKAQFYSDWIYSGVRLGSALDGLNTTSNLATRFQLPEKKVAEVLDFLVRTGLAVEENGAIKMGPQRIHLESNSPYVKSRQMSWRLKGFERMSKKQADELFYTAPMCLNKKSVAEFKEILTNAIEKINEKVIAEKPDDLMCLNIDFFRF
jgi:uncharacterized protein (TIGR02147 family)